MIFAELLDRLVPSLFAEQVGKIAGSWKQASVHAGDLTVDGPWSPPSSPFIVEGDLVVDGTLLTCASDRDGDLLVVAGAVRCQDLFGCPEATTYVGGALEVAGLLFAATRDLIFEVFGPVRAGTLVSGAGAGWMTSYHDEIVASGFYDYVTDGRTRGRHAAMASLPRTDLRAMVDEVLDFEEWACMSDDERAAEAEAGQSKYSYACFDEDAVEGRFRQGLPIVAGR